MKFLTAPSERPPIELLGPKSAIPELHGADIYWDGLEGPCGIQRKTNMDLIASVRGEGGDRLGKELEQMQQSLKHRFLVIEGQPQWTSTGELVSQHTRWSLNQQYGVELSAQLYGVMVLHTRSAIETVSVAEYLYGWTQRPHDTSSLLARGNAKRNGWGKIDDRSTAIQMYSTIPAVGVDRAAKIYDAGVRLLRCGTTVEELVAISGIGRKTAETIIKSIGVKDGS